MSRAELGKDQWLVVSSAPGDYSTALIRALGTQGLKGIPLEVGPDAGGAAAALVPFSSGSSRPSAILVVDNRPQVRRALAEQFKDTPVIFDTYLDDPLDLARDGWPGQTYFSTYMSRGIKQDNALGSLSAGYSRVFGQPMTPPTAYGAAAFQIIGQALRVGEIGKVQIKAANSLCGFAIGFDNQGVNTAAGKPKLLRLSGTELADVTPTPG